MSTQREFGGSDEEKRERWLRYYNQDRASRGKPPLSFYELERRAELERAYRDATDPDERARAAAELARQDGLDEPRHRPSPLAAQSPTDRKSAAAGERPSPIDPADLPF